MDMGLLSYPAQHPECPHVTMEVSPPTPLAGNWASTHDASQARGQRYIAGLGEVLALTDVATHR